MLFVNVRLRAIGAVLLCAASAAVFGPAQAQSAEPPARSRWDAPIDITLPHTAAEHYTFDSFALDSEDGERHYRVYVGIPKRPAPASGYPVIYLLDGNAAMVDTSPEMLAALQSKSPPVFVAIGYDVPGRHDILARAYDYTPPVATGGAVKDEVVVRGRKGGGADIFLKLIEQKIKPEVQSRASIDLTRQTLWGHSYGGLFTLHTLFTHPASFQRYVAGDPSIWWGDGVILNEAKAFDATLAASTIVRVYAGDARRSTSTPRAGSQADSVAAQMPPPNAGPEVIQRLIDAGLDISLTVFEGKSHGQLFKLSLVPGLELAATP